MGYATKQQMNSLRIAKSVAAYSLLPDFWSRILAFVPRFGMLAYLMAIVFEAVRLFPHNHPFSNAVSMSTYRIRDVLGYAASRLQGGYRNTDHYIVFGMFLLGTILLLVQFVLLFILIINQTAQAGSFIAGGMFVNVKPETDISYLMLDRIFGIPKFFGSCFDGTISHAAGVCTNYQATATFPTPFQKGLQALFQFYSMGMMVVAGFLVLYLIFAMIVETAGTGVPFGTRFQSVFSPIRLVIAVLLLVPLAYGLNTGQYIVLWAAKYGSAMATNSWILFNQVGMKAQQSATPATNYKNPLNMSPAQLIGNPTLGEISSIVNFMYMVSVCEAAYDLKYGMVMNAYFVNSSPSSSMVAFSKTFSDAKTFYKNGDVKIVFGRHNASYTNYAGNVKPYCGVLTMPALSKDVSGINNLYNAYFSVIWDIYSDPAMQKFATRMVCNIQFSKDPKCNQPSTAWMEAAPANWGAEDKDVAGQKFYSDQRLTFQSLFNSTMGTEINNLRNTANPALEMNSTILASGWGGAGIWFNRVMEYNGAVVDSLHSMPVPIQMPMVSEHATKKMKAAVRDKQLKDTVTPCFREMPSAKHLPLDKLMDDADLGGDKTINFEFAQLFSEVYCSLQKSGVTSRPKIINTDNPVKNFTGMLFGQGGIFNFMGNDGVFPLAKLSMFGREIINKTVTMLAATTLMSGVASFADADMGPLGGAAKSFGPGMQTFAVMAISIGILLYYVVPLMPFIYCFFAVGQWVKSVLEAMIAVPLWALAHLRLGGDGIPGPAAGTGYFLILEIFLRPILTLFGLICAMAVFMAMTSAIDSIFHLAVSNVGGFNMATFSATSPSNELIREGMDALFYTGLYAILVYTIATSSFKLIDLIPNSIMRWGGTNTASFSDQTDEIQQTNLNMVYRADFIARGIADTGSNMEKNFADKARDRELLK